MQWLTFLGGPLVLFDFEPNWSAGVEVSLRVPGRVEGGVGRDESRQAFADTPRYAMRYNAAAYTAADVRRLREGCLRLRGEMVAMPLWTDGNEVSENAAIGDTVIHLDGVARARTGALWVLMSEDRQTVEFVTTTAATASQLTLSAGLENAWPTGTVAYPVLCGFFAKRPQFRALSDEAADVEIDFRESSEYARRVWTEGTLAVVGATVPAWFATRLWDMEPHFSQPLDMTELEEMIEELGFVREAMRYVPEDAEVRRGMEWTLKPLDRATLGRMERFFADRRGSLRRFFAPSYQGDLELLEDLPMATANLMHVRGDEYLSGEYDDHPGQPYLVLIDDGAPVPVRVNLVAGSVLTLATNVPRAFSAANTIVSKLILARFATQELKWTYQAPGVAEATVQLVEVPQEYLGGAPDERTPGYLFEFIEQRPTPLVSRFTSYEAPIVLDGNTWTPGPFSQGAIRSSVTLDREEMDLASFAFPGNPLGKFLPLRLEGPLRLRLWELADPTAPAAPKLRFAGEVTKAPYKGRKINAKVLAVGRALDRSFPRVLVQRTCNTSTYSEFCGASRADFQKAGVVQAASTGTTVRLAGAALNAATANQYANGFIEFSGGAAGFARRTILSHAAWSGSYLEVQIERPVTLDGSETVFVVPVCDNTVEGCHAFGRYPRGFRGFPFLPDRNPTLKAIDVPTAQSGK